MLLKKFFNVGFDGIRVSERRGFGLADLGRYPLFAPDFIDFLGRIMPSHRHAELVFAVVVTAHKPEAPPGSEEGVVRSEALSSNRRGGIHSRRGAR